jgi:hypothetical protein
MVCNVDVPETVLPIGERAHWETFANTELRDCQTAVDLAVDALAPERMKLRVGATGHGVDSCEAMDWYASQVTKPGKNGIFGRIR